jgi:hypothetical protein
MSMQITLEAAAAVPWRRRTTARLAVAAARVAIQLSPRHLRQVLAFARHGARPATAAQVLQARAAVVSVSVRCAGQGCLQRSVATVLLCRLGGVWPDWCTGVLTEPFRAHAWVEIDGEPVGEGDHMPPFQKVMIVPLPAAHPHRPDRAGFRHG